MIRPVAWGLAAVFLAGLAAADDLAAAIPSMSDDELKERIVADCKRAYPAELDNSKFCKCGVKKLVAAIAPETLRTSLIVLVASDADSAIPAETGAALANMAPAAYADAVKSLSGALNAAVRQCRRSGG